MFFVEILTNGHLDTSQCAYLLSQVQVWQSTLMSLAKTVAVSELAPKRIAYDDWDNCYISDMAGVG